MFHLNNTKSVEVPMMNIRNLRTPYFRDEELSCTLVELKYRGNASALFILPDEGRMQQVEASLQPETLRKWRDSLRPRCVLQDPDLVCLPSLVSAQCPCTSESH